jgi:carboxymethylenebutenolidase
VTDRNRDSFSVDQLNQMQRYLGEETIEDYQAGLMTRRQMLKRLLGICGSGAAVAALLVACGATSTAAPTPTTGAPPPTQPPTSGAAAPTEPPTAAPQPTAAPAAATAAPQPTAAPAAATAAPQPAAGATSPLSVPADDPAVTGAAVTFAGDTTINGYLARPKAEGTYPGVIVIHENRGLTDHIRDVARRLAKAGYVALAPDLASRAGGTEKVGGQITGYFANAKPEELVSDLNAAVAFLGQQSGVQPDKYGVVGFCFGGAYTLRLAAANPKMAAAVCYYGVTPEPASQMSATNAAILGQYGGNDARVNSTIPALEQVMQSSGKTYEKRIYEGANHAFNNDTGANYNEAAAVAAWQETLAWFDKYLNA